VSIGERAQQPLQLDRLLSPERRTGDRGGAAVSGQMMHKPILVDFARAAQGSSVLLLGSVDYLSEYRMRVECLLARS
jgi:hypothetical protein